MTIYTIVLIAIAWYLLEKKEKVLFDLFDAALFAVYTAWSAFWYIVFPLVVLVLLGKYL